MVIMFLRVRVPNQMPRTDRDKRLQEETRASNEAKIGVLYR
jgi:hypothetical protein